MFWYQQYKDQDLIKTPQTFYNVIASELSLIIIIKIFQLIFFRIQLILVARSNIVFQEIYFHVIISDLICGPPPTKPTTTQRTTTRIPTPFPKIVNAIQATPKSEVRLGSRQNLPRRRSGVVGSTNDNSFINNARRIPDKIQQQTFNSGTAKPVKKFNNNPGMTSTSYAFTDYNIIIKLIFMDI